MIKLHCQFDQNFIDICVYVSLYILPNIIKVFREYDIVVLSY